MNIPGKEPSPSLIAVGRITGAHGLRGEVAVLPLTDFPERLESGRTVLLETPQGGVSERRILGARGHKGHLILLLDGVADRTSSESLRGGWLRVREENLMPLPAGRYYQHDLIGMAVRTEDGEDLGPVREIMDTGGQTIILVVHGPRGEILIPFVEAMIRNVDPEGRRITVQLWEGLLPEEGARSGEES